MKNWKANRSTRSAFSLLICVACVIALGARSSAGASEPLLHAVKLDWERISQSQKAFVMRRIRFYALVEATLARCGRPSNFEHRMIAAIRDCVEAGTIERLVRQYRAMLHDQRQKLTQSFCDNVQYMLAGLREELDKDIAAASQMCRTCVVC